MRKDAVAVKESKEESMGSQCFWQLHDYLKSKGLFINNPQWQPSEKQALKACAGKYLYY